MINPSEKENANSITFPTLDESYMNPTIIMSATISSELAKKEKWKDDEL